MRRLLFVVKLLVTVFVTVAVLHYVGSEQVLATFEQASPGPILIGAALIVVSIAVGAVRWCWIVSHSEAELHLLPAIRLLFEALFFNQLLPSMVGGDAVRVVRATTTSELALGTSFRSVVIDRATGLLALNALAACGLVALFVVGLPVGPEVLFASGLMILLGAGGVLALLGIGLLANDRWRALVPERLRRAYDQVVMIGKDFVRLNASPSRFGVLNGLGILVHLLVIAATFFLGLGLGVESGLFGYFVAVPISILVAVLPISIAGWGVREAMMIAAFNTVGIQSGEALAVSILFGASLALLGLVGGALFVANSGHLRAIREAAEDDSAPEAMLVSPDGPSLRTSPGAERMN
jgi:uncharacterized protein (TIRG00374 family)